MPETDLSLNLWELAARFNVSEPTVRKWVREGCPVLRGGDKGVPYAFDMVAVKEWCDGVEAKEQAEEEERIRLLDEQQAELFGRDELGPLVAGAGGLSPDARLKLVRAKLEETKLGRERGKLVVANVVRVGLSVAMAEMTSRLRGIPDQLGRVVGLTDAQVDAALTMIDDAIEDAVTKSQTLLGEREDAEADALPPVEGLNAAAD